MRIVGISGLLLACAACSDAARHEDADALAERDIAMVREANATLPPLREVTPEPIQYSDLERYDMFGLGCNYAPGTSLATRVIARESDAFIKVNGEVHRLAADPGSPELPARSHSLYDGRTYSLRLKLEDTADRQAAEEEESIAAGEDESESERETAPEDPTDFEGTVFLRDEYGRVVFRGTGLAQCGT